MMRNLSEDYPDVCTDVNVTLLRRSGGKRGCGSGQP
jgi:hypothetical protein